MKNKKILFLIAIVFVFALSGCASLRSYLNDLKGNLVGNSFTIETYDNYGSLTMTSQGDKINLKGNRVREATATDEGYVYSYSLSSIITVTIDGKEMESCGDTMIFAEKGLKKELDFTNPEFIKSNSSFADITNLTSVAYKINEYTNKIGKKRVVVIKSQTGQPLCAYSGNSVYWEIPDNLPKTTKLMIDGKALYIHRANFQIIDKSLIE